MRCAPLFFGSHCLNICSWYFVLDLSLAFFLFYCYQPNETEFSMAENPFRETEINFHIATFSHRNSIMVWRYHGRLKRKRWKNHFRETFLLKLKLRKRNGISVARKFLSKEVAQFEQKQIETDKKISQIYDSTCSHFTPKKCYACLWLSTVMFSISLRLFEFENCLCLFCVCAYSTLCIAISCHRPVSNKYT